MKDLVVKSSSTRTGLAAAEIVNLIGVILAVFGFIFGPWLGSRSGLWVLVDLATRLFGPDRPAAASRQQAIFALLVALALVLIGLALALSADLRTKKRYWSVAGILLAVGALLLLAVLFFSYDARTVGVMLTALGCMIAVGSALAVIYGGLREGFPERSKGLPKVEQMWAGVLVDARASDSPLSVLALSTSELITSEVAALVDDQLRARDIEYPMRESLFVLLWATDTEGAMAAARHVQEILTEQGHGHTWIGVASFPEDADQMGTLLERALQAHEIAREFCNQSMIVPFSYPKRSESLPALEKAWEPTLARARASHTPLAIVAMATSRAPRADDVALAEEELRTQDRVFPVREGLFILLWKASPHSAERVAFHLRETLASSKDLHSHVGMANLPEDGDQLGELLERAESALEAGRAAGP